MSLMKRLLFIFFALLFFLGGCSSDLQPELSDTYQAVSALGDTMYAPTLDDEIEREFNANLDKAKADYEMDPTDADNIIWYGRRLAYLGDYRKAIDVFTEGVEEHPDDARMYRHRGHRYITVREFSQAIEDFEQAIELIENTEDEVEPDGLPNEEDNPRSTLHTNIWYHYGLTHYLNHDFEQAAEAFQRCVDISPNDDMLVASTYWLYMALRRDGRDGLAGEVLDPINEEMNIIENGSYHKLLLVFNGSFDEKTLAQNGQSELEDATLGYGLGNWHYINGRTEKAFEIWQQVYDNGSWPAFGFIAAEMELAKR